MGIRCEAWDLLHWKNGDADRLSFLRRIGEYRSIDLLDPSSERAPIGCNVLRAARFWPRERRISWGKEVGWLGNVIRGSTERDPVRARPLLQTIAEDGLDAPEEFSDRFTLLNVDWLGSVSVLGHHASRGSGERRLWRNAGTFATSEAFS